MDENTGFHKKKILITGGTGFVGVNLVKYLKENTKWKINILDNYISSQKEDLFKILSNTSDIKVFQGDIRVKEDVLKAIEGCNYVVNLAAQTSVVQSTENPFLDEEINIKGLLNLLTISVENKIEKFIQASSNATLGEHSLPLHEGLVPQPLSPYGASKLAGEAYCSAFSSSFSIKSVVLRFSSIFGPHSIRKGSVVAKFIKQCLDEEAVTIYGDGSQTRDFLYVKDASKAVYLSLVKELQNNYELINIGSGEEISIDLLYKLVRENFERRGYIIKDPIYTDFRAGEIIRNSTFIKKAEKILEYKPSSTFIENLNVTIEWFIENY